MKRNRFKRTRSWKQMSAITVGILVLIGVFVTAMLLYCKRPVPQMKKCHSGPGLSIETLKYHSYFLQAGAGIHALEVAKAVQHSKRKRLAAAICVVESQGKKTAYNRRSKAKGLFQVKEVHWSKVNTKSALAMTAQHDAIMDELLRDSNGNLKKALNAYGGDVTKKVYAENVLEEMSKVP